VSVNAREPTPRLRCVADSYPLAAVLVRTLRGETAVVLSVFAKHLSNRNLGTYWGTEGRQEPSTVGSSWTRMPSRLSAAGPGGGS
jgi:hypothetical protein